MRYRTSAFLLCLAIALGAASTGLAQAIERSGNVFHKAVCPGPAAPRTARCHAHVVTDRAGNVLEDVTRNATPAGYGPSDLLSAYKVTGTGATTTVAIVDAYGYSNAESDLAVYRAQFGLPPCTTSLGCFKKVNQNGVQGSYPSQNTGWDQEQALDLDMVSAMCPTCHIILVQATSPTFGNLAAAENTAVALGATVVSNSYGGGELGSQSYESAYDHVGVAITVSTGDSGYGVQFPASAPNVTAAGGTSLTHASNNRGWNETVWSGAGSGCSSVYAKQKSWQHDPLCTTRMEADVAAVADPSTGVAVYGPASRRASAWLVFGGTSVAAPLIGGLYGRAGAGVSDASKAYANVSSLFDVTSGSNGSCGGTYFCTASSPASPNGNGGTTYDGPTGLGTPNGLGAF